MKFTPIKNQEFFSKPEGGLWGSPVDCAFGWKQWCEESKFNDCSEDNAFRFTLSDSANILIVNSANDLNGLPINEPPIPISIWISLDFEKLLENGIDAIQVNMSNDNSNGKWGERLYNKLYGWDCDAILVMNKKVIIDDLLN